MEKKELIKKLFFNPTLDYLATIKEVDYKKVLSNDLVYLKPVLTDDDLRYCFLDFELEDDQVDLVNPPYISISRAYISPYDYHPFIICSKDDKMIGFICLNKWIPKKDAFSFSLAIDKHYQKKGYGKSSIKLAIEILQTINPNFAIKIATEVTNEKAQKLYESLGFKKLNELDGNDLVFAYRP